MSQYVHESWSTDSGLPAGPIYSIAQTSDGYLWIGTEKALIRFDGFAFQVIQSELPKNTSLSHVLGLLSSGDGSLWVRLRRPTLLHYRNGIFDDLLARIGLEDYAGSAMTQMNDGALLLWALDSEASAVVLRPGGAHTNTKLRNFTRSPVLAIAQTSDGDIWIGTRDSGLFRMHGSLTTPVSQGLPDLKVNALMATKDNRLWVATDAGIALWDGAKLTQVGVPRSLKGVQVLAMTMDRDGNLWLGTNSQGLLRVNGQGVSALIDTSHDITDAITSIFEDREGALWFGSARGLERLRDSAFVTYSLPEGVPSDGNNPVFADSAGRIWIPPLSGGLWWMKDGRLGKVSNDGLDHDLVYSLAGKGQDLWIGRQHGGLTRLRSVGSSFSARTYTQRDGLAQNSIFSVMQAQDGSVWAGTLSGGVTHFNYNKKDDVTTYTIADGLPSNTITAILETPDGAIWLSTPGGLSVFSGRRWRTFTLADGLPSQDVNCLLQDSAGRLWIGTAAGLSFRDGARFQTPPNPPASLREPIFGMAEDGHGYLWITTSNHVLQVDRQKLMSGELREGDIHEYGPADGLRGLEGVKRSRSVVTDQLGRIWMSLNRGISVVAPDRLMKNSVPAIAHIQAIAADGKPLKLTSDLRLPGGHKRISFGFAGLSLSIPERVRYRYMLEGFDHDWSAPVRTREAVYTNLGPGQYHFHLMVSNSDGVWNREAATIALVVDPLFWQTWWFRVSCVLVAAGVLLIGYRLRLRQMARHLNFRFEERINERTRIAQELHDTLLQGFLSASMHVHIASDGLGAESPVKPTLTRALEMMGQVIEEGRNAVRGLRSSSSGSLDLEHAFSLLQEEVALRNGSGHQTAFRVIVDGEPLPLHPVLRDEVYRIGREALLNAFHHARANQIELELKYSSRRFRVLVRDDGCGIDPGILKAGRDGHWGLSGMRERANRIGAAFHLWSSLTAGTEVELSVPAHLAYRGGGSSWSNPFPQLFAGRRLKRNHHKNGSEQ